MKKIFLFTALVALVANQIIAQAPVPTSWDVTNVNPPTGWSIGGGPYDPSIYSNDGNVSAPSVKMNADGQYVQVYLAAEAGVFEYYLKGMTIGSSSFQGTFDIKTSDNGSSWTTVRSIVNTDIDVNTYTLFSDTCHINTRYIRFFYTDKVSGWNLSLDDISVGIPLAKPEAEINAVIDTDTIFSGGNYYTGEILANTKRINVIIQNQGTDSTLKITNATSSNPNFVVLNTVLNIPFLSSDTIKIDFTPSTSGTISSLLTINNNDANENPYLINLVGYGNGLATEPSTPSVVTSNSKTYSYEVNITPVTPLADEGYLVVFKNGAAPVGAPVDGQTYGAGDPIGNAKVAYIGTSLSCFPKEVYANSTYHLAVYAYSGNGQYTNYTGLPGITSITTPTTMQVPAHYNSLSTSVSTFIDDLHALTNPHTLRFYGDFDDTYINEFGSRDTTNGNKVVTCRYSSFEYIYTPPFNFSVISREHSFPQSWMPTWGNQNLPEYSDYHNLFATHQNSANAVRSNNPLGEVVVITSTFQDGTYGTDANGNKVYEPRDSHKGDAARAMFYMSAAYTTVNGASWSFPDPISTDPISPMNYGQDQDVLKKWHWQDPVSKWEMARNDYIETLQGNRNPFIDSMQYACYIDFKTMTRVVSSSPCLTTPVSIDEVTNLVAQSIYPNPANSNVFVNYTLNKTENVSISLIDIYGKTIKIVAKQKQQSVSYDIDLSNIASGIYFVKLKGESFTKLIKLVKD
jgi:hypothetical protein